MKTRSIFLAIIAVGIVAASARSEVHFQNLSFDAAKKLAAKEHKKVMIDFYTTWCGWCKVLDRDTYSDATVGKTADEKFISLKIDAEKGEGRGLAQQYKITGYPTIIFFTADGKVIDKVVGFEDAGKFLRSMKNAAAGGTALVLEEVGAKKACKDPAKWIVAANYYAEHGDKEMSLKSFNQALELDPENKHGLREEATYGAAFTTPSDAQWTKLESAINEYPMSDEGGQAVEMLIKHDLDVKNGPEASRLMDRWAMRHPDDARVFNFFAWNAAGSELALDRAEYYAKRALDLAKTPQDKASVMDTRAEVFFRSNRLSEAVTTEQNALALLDEKQDAKLYAALTKQKAKFQATLDAKPTGSAMVPSQSSASTVSSNKSAH
jgi:thioredoxin-related protein